MRGVRPRVVSRQARWLGFCLLGGALSLGCDAGTASSIFSADFVDVVAGDAEEPVASIKNAPGHVPILFVNNLRYDSQLVSYLEALQAERRLGNLADFTGDLSSLRPRVRVRIQVVFEDGGTLPFEFVSGDGVVEIERLDEDEDDEEIPGIPEEPLDPVLTQNDLERLVATCEVLAVSVEGNPQVFVPVFTRVIRVEVNDLGFQTRVLVRTDRPQFRPVLPDEVDDNLNITLRRNYSVREAPAPAVDLSCGSMIGIVMEGTVSMPFTEPEDDPEDEFVAGRSAVPGFVDTDAPAEASIPGRFKFTVQVR